MRTHTHTHTRMQRDKETYGCVRRIRFQITLTVKIRYTLMEYALELRHVDATVICGWECA